MQNYKLITKKGEGTFSEVIKAQSIKTSQLVAIKCMKQVFQTIDQVFNYFQFLVNKLKEIQALRKLQNHDHIIKLIEVLYDEPTGRLALVFELMEQNLYEHIKGRKVSLKQDKIRSYMYQLLKAIDFMHTNNIFHRDIKPENILLLNDHLKLADLGSCKGIYSKHPYTEYISTRWYRSPECLMTDGYYDSKMDIWGAGCVLFEITALFPLFPGSNELDQVHRIHNILGTPNPKVLDRFRKHASHMEINFPSKVGTGLENLIPHAPKDLVDLIKQMLIYDPEERINAKQALRHPYFKELRDQEQQKLLETSLQSIKLLKKHGDDSLIEEEQNTSHILHKKTLFNQTNKILQNSFKTRNQQLLDSVKLPTLTKKQADLKKAYGPGHFQNKETKKKSVQYEYVLYGKKANLGNFLNTIRQK
ncbi:unnamed protein product [Paramecium primaurelia]|uniref:Protein kinase domain-containing protein n=2 Tax=Paramecium TaxID=5884 RepID=A0A8S1V3X6_9CILI|nr:unnamed protein product [Paramecium primaurelia]CAD8171605.1 unnamed protein product [Paramecium pentaurelia]